MPADIPAATLAAADHADPDWWEACARWHEEQAEFHREHQYPEDWEEHHAHHSAAALACRAFALMMGREAWGDLRGWWINEDGGCSVGVSMPHGYPRTLPQAVAVALREEG